MEATRDPQNSTWGWNSRINPNPTRSVRPHWSIHPRIQGAPRGSSPIPVAPNPGAAPGHPLDIQPRETDGIKTIEIPIFPGSGSRNRRDPTPPTHLGALPLPEFLPPKSQDPASSPADPAGNPRPWLFIRSRPAEIPLRELPGARHEAAPIPSGLGTSPTSAS